MLQTITNEFKFDQESHIIKTRISKKSKRLMGKKMFYAYLLVSEVSFAKNYLYRDKYFRFFDNYSQSVATNDHIIWK